MTDFILAAEGSATRAGFWASIIVLLKAYSSKLLPATLGAFFGAAAAIKLDKKRLSYSRERKRLFDD